MATWDLSSTKHHVLICNGSSCNRAGAEELTQAIRKEISERDVDHMIHTTRTRCNGRCHDKCVVIHYPLDTWYRALTPEEAPLFVDSLLSDENYQEKVSHSFQEHVLQRTPGVIAGTPKEKEKVMKVSMRVSF